VLKLIMITALSSPEGAPLGLSYGYLKLNINYECSIHLLVHRSFNEGGSYGCLKLNVNYECSIQPRS